MNCRPLNVLVPTDGSANAAHAIDYALRLAQCGLVSDVHLVTAQPPVDSAVSTFVGKKAVAGYHFDEGMKALAPAKAKLEAANIRHQIHIGVGQPADVITGFCHELGCDVIIVGSHGRTGAAAVILGSVAQAVIAKSKVPVTLVK